VADRDIAVKFTGDSSDLERASDKAERSIADTGKSMGGSLAGLAGPAAIAGAAIAGVAMVGWDLAQSAMEDEAAASQLAQQLRQAAGASDEAVAGAETYIETLSKAAAVADDELRPALATLATATGDTTKAQDLLALATDISAGTGKDLGTVTQALAKAQLGSIGGLSKLGIATEDADGKALSLEETLAKARDTFKGAGEAAANTSAGGMKKAQIGFDEFKESIGAKLLPVLGTLSTFFTEKVLPGIESLVAWVEENWPRIMEQIGPSLTDLQNLVTEVLTNISSFWNEWGDEIMTIVGRIAELWVTEIATKIRIVVAIITWIADTIKAFWAEWGDEIMTGVKAVADFIGGVIEWIGAFWLEWGDEITEGARTAFDIIMGIVRFAMDVIGSVIKFVTSVITGDWGGAFDALKHIAQIGIDFVLDLFNKVGGLINAALAGIADLITRPFKAAFNAIADLWNNTIGKLEWTVPDWIPGIGGNRVEVPDIPRFQTFGALTIVMPPGSDGYDVARQVSSFSRNVAPMGTLSVAVR